MGRGRSGSTTVKRDRDTKRRIYKYDEEGIKDLEFVRDGASSHEKDVVILVNPQKLDANWSKDKNFYIPPGGGGAEIKGRRESFREFMKKGRPIEVSRVHLSKSGQVGFANGRHRYSVLRDDRKARRIPIAVPRSQAERFRRLFGN